MVQPLSRFSQLFCGTALSCGPFVAPFSVACFWPGYFEEVAFRGFPNGFQRCEDFLNLVDLEKCCKMSIWLQRSASIQPRTSPPKFFNFS